ncbi:hypothetical protein Cni_G16362 [Canna indica]|uniref:Protein kinase domain-containing protein n=1 Tax=Canna indica TaxID=4628 RepID=A0AAQ3KF79_9LILI|nr:hypothetical protein Cni_G16362 [Canna indica]
MGCLCYLREKNGSRGRWRSKPKLSSGEVCSPTSDNRESRSEDSVSKQISKSSGSVSSHRSIPELYYERARNLHVFRLKELRNATDNFSRMQKIGEGGFGSVYKGFVTTLRWQSRCLILMVSRVINNGGQKFSFLELWNTQIL